jgi:calcium-dependent protein kinase
VLNDLSNNENLAKIHKVYKSHEMVYLVMELVEGPSLRAYICENGSISESDARGVMRELLTTVSYLHTHKVLHRDIKPANILLKGDCLACGIKIIDFGLSAVHDRNELLYSRCGTRGYLAPELTRSQGYNEKADVFSCGVVLLTCV